MFLFLVSEKAELRGGCPLTYPAASRANAVAPRRLIRTRLPEGENFAFAASKRTAKIEKLTRIGIEAPLDLLGGKLQRFEPRPARIANLGQAFPTGVGGTAEP